MEAYDKNKARQHVLITLLLIFVLQFLAMATINHPSIKALYESPEYPMWQQVKNQVVESGGERFSLVVIGDSRSKAGFIPADKTMLNLSLGGSTAIEAYFTLEKLLASGAKIDKLVLSYSPYHLMRQEVFWERTVNYHYIDHKEYLSIRQRANELHQGKAKAYDVLGEQDRWWAYRLLLGMHYQNIKNGIFNDYPAYQDVYQQLENNGGHYFFGQEKGSDLVNLEAGLKKFHRSLLLHDYLQKTVELARKNDITVYWYTMPFNQASCKKVKPAFKSGLQKYLSSLQNLKVVQDFACWPNSQFGDADHLYLGAKTSSEQIIKAVLPARQ